MSNRFQVEPWYPSSCTQNVNLQSDWHIRVGVQYIKKKRT